MRLEESCPRSLVNRRRVPKPSARSVKPLGAAIASESTASTPQRETRRSLPDVRWPVLSMVTLALSLLAVPLAAEMHRAGPVHRIGFIGFHSAGLENRLIAYFQERLAELGYVDGRNASISYRWADGQISNYPAVAADLVRAGVDVIVAPCGPIVPAIRKLDATIPLVVRSVDVKTCGGELDVLERPGGYTTGAIYFSPEATGRRLEVLTELIPGLSHVGVLYRPASEWTEHWADAETAAARLGLRLHRAKWDHPAGLPSAFDDAIGQRVGALMTFGDGVTFYHRHRIFELAAARKLPVLYDFPMPPAAFDSGLMSYAVDVRSLFQHIAERVDRILRGDKPGDIPVARPSRFRLIIDPDVAQSLGLAIPRRLLRRNRLVEDLAHDHDG